MRRLREPKETRRKLVVGSRITIYRLQVDHCLPTRQVLAPLAAIGFNAATAMYGAQNVSQPGLIRKRP
jgi:hypothetical protein